MSQDFDLEPFTNMNTSNDATNDTTTTSTIINMIISCHSHAPLQEFWDRLHSDHIHIKCKMKKIAITMACCSNYAELNDDILPILEFDDFEVYSPKRRVKIYYDDTS